MKDDQTINRFVELRAAGWSFARIAAELHVAKPTLIQWSRKHQYLIQNLRAMEVEAIKERYLANCEFRASALAQQLGVVEQEIKKRDLSTLPTSRLYALADTLHRQLRQEFGEMTFTAPVKEIPHDEYTEQVQDWAP